MDYYEVLDFWFEELEPKQWFEKNSKVDDMIREKFLDLHKDITCGRYQNWRGSSQGSLALILVLDQFSRNMFRDTDKMFSYDKMALNIAKESLEKGFDKEVEKGRNFFYLPFMHSEELEDQKKCIELFRQLAKDDNKDEEESIKWAIAHKDIIEKFGRFPHRNEILERPSTTEEEKFLKEPGSSF